MQAPYFSWHVSPTWLAHLFKAVAKQHHQELIPVFARFIRADAVVFDVGAHAGQFAKLFSRLAGAGQVYAFEPGSYARSVLRLAVHFNRRRSIAIVPMGLGEAPGIGLLTLPVKRRGSYGFGLAHLGPHDRPGEVRQEVIALTTVDAVAGLLGLERLDFVKADIEGWELHMLRGARETLRRFRPVLLLEMVESQLARGGDDLGGAWRLLAELGYRGHVLDPGNRLRRLEEPAEGDIWWLPEERAEEASGG
jgi:FkbM family methyltransferase